MSVDAELVTVTLLDLPVALHARAGEHSDEMQREFRLLSEQLRDHRDAGVPRRLVELTRTLVTSYSGFTLEQEAQLESAIAEGRPTIDLAFRVPVHAADAARDLGAMFDEADDYCREGRHLLTLATPPDLVAYRRWYLQQFMDQPSGSAPAPWASAPG